MQIDFGSVASGIEAASVAFEPLGWKAAWFAEIEPFPCAVLAHHYPAVPNLGDMKAVSRRVLTGEIPAPSVLCGGTPCQAFSVAGLRESLADERGNLTLKFVEIADAIDHVRTGRGEDECIVLWENVPGVLNTKDNAFGCFLAGLAGEDGALEPPGGKWANAGAVYGPSRAAAWRTLDAQYFGLAQRRRRVFVVASARKDFDPAQVLFEWDGVRRDSAPSRQAGQEAAGSLARCTAGGGLGTDFDCDGGLIAGTLQAGGKAAGSATQQDAESGLLLPVAFGGNNQSGPISSGGGDKPHVLCEALYNKGLNHGGLYASTQETHTGKILRTLREAVGEEAFAQWGLGILGSLQSPEILRQALHGLSIRPAAFSRSWVVHCALSRSENGSGWLLQSLREAGCERCASQGWEPSEQLAGKLGAYLSELSQPGAQASRFVRDLWWAAQGPGLLREALSAVQEVGRPTHGQSQPAHGGMQVRRLTVEECEFLQGFPRSYTAIPWRGKPADQCPDGPRYKALGNSWAVPNVTWIGRRIAKTLHQKP